MQIKQFEDILAWQKSKKLCLLVYKNFKESKDWSFKDQIQRASVSVMNNIAEGFERKSIKEFRQYLFIAKGSCGEVRSMLYLADELNMIDQNTYKEMNSLALETSRMISGFIKTLKI